MPLIKIGKNRNCEFDLHYELHSFGSTGTSGFKNKLKEPKEKVMLVFGFLTPLSAWRQNLNQFKKDPNYEYCVFDTRGIGETESPSNTYSTYSMAMDIIDLMDHLKWEKAHVVGVSMGGMISLELAYHAPNRIKSLALIVTHAGSIAPLTCISNVIKSLFIRDLSKRAEILANILYSKEFLKLESIDTPGITNLQYFIGRFIDEMKNPNKQPNISALYGHIRAVNTHRVSKSRLLKIKQSIQNITIMTGTNDNMVKSSNSFYLNEILSPNEFIVFKGSGHSVNIENYFEFHDAISRNFKRSLDPSTNNTTATTSTILSKQE